MAKISGYAVQNNLSRWVHYPGRVGINQEGWTVGGKGGQNTAKAGRMQEKRREGYK
jgi:hypothetical protein